MKAFVEFGHETSFTKSSGHPELIKNDTLRGLFSFYHILFTENDGVYVQIA